MKKLMFAALAVASCSAMAAKNVQVNDLTISKKALAYATKSYSIKFEGATPSNALENAEAQFNELIWGKDGIVSNKVDGLDFDESQFAFDGYRAKIKDDATKGTLKVTLPALGKNGLSTKVVTTKINGLVIVRGNERPNTYLWDNTKNEYAKDGFKFWGHLIPSYFYNPIVTLDGKASLTMFLGDPYVKKDHGFSGVATGTCDKKTGVIKSVAGNFADAYCNGYGTWKYALNNSLTKKAQDDASGVNTDEDILALKKVELVK